MFGGDLGANHVDAFLRLGVMLIEVVEYLGKGPMRWYLPLWVRDYGKKIRRERAQGP